MGIFGKVLVGIGMVVIIVLLGGLFLESQFQSGSLSREAICGNELSTCLNICEDKFIKHFCKNDCQKRYDSCMGY